LNSSIDTRLQRLAQASQQQLLRHGLKGVEKESLRLTPGGLIAQTPHPAALGSALTHSWITTDYSEALTELITPPFADPADVLRFLGEIHAFVYRHLGEELLLGTSMPIGLSGDESIPIAHYGSSNIGRMKQVYRRGLGYRYGRTMQSIAGVHFNYSVNEALWPVLWELDGNSGPLRNYIADAYFGIIRNIHRYAWLLIYLLGNSPVVCKSFFAGRQELAAVFSEFDRDTLYRPFATSLRMSDIGYRNNNQAGLDISFNHLDDYVASLTEAINRPYPPYERIGVKVNGEYRQLNANILQIENEYYSVVRPKQITRSGEKPTLALKRRGVHYLELRVLDLNSFAPAGISLDEMRFLETFILFCLLVDSPFLGSEEKAESSRNSLTAACCGRTPGFRLARAGREVSVPEWAEELLDGMAKVAEVLDGDDPSRPYSRGVECQRAVIDDPDRTPAARIVADMRRTGESFAAYALRHAQEYAALWREYSLEPERTETFRLEAEASWEEQRRIEAADTLSFDEFLQRYFAQA
jgi:glutamate--cysteine ligase